MRVPYYWVVVDDKPTSLPFEDVEQAKQLVMEHLSSDPSARAAVEIYDGAKPVTRVVWDKATEAWTGNPHY
jgi:hypothetical protein